MVSSSRTSPDVS
uniref:Uncharacterized protein n=1 Tax=Rhizophora mucronata TaxID=61149 RepID=A0A2P2NB86_RHIMU